MQNCEKSLSKDIFALLPAHIYQKDINGVYLKCSDLQAHIFGYKTGEELVGKTDYDLLDKKQADYIRANDLKATQTRKTLVIEEHAILPNGAEAIYLSKKVPLFDDKGENIGILGFSTDITEDKKRREHALLEIKTTAEKKEKGVKNYYENLIALLPGNVYWMDLNNVFLGCNNQQAEHAGLKSRYEIVGKTNYDMPWKEQADALNALNNKVMETGIPYETEENATMIFGDEIKEGIFLSQKIPLFDEVGNVIGLLGISIDITERKRAEQLELEKQIEVEKLRLTEAFSATLAHDLRNPVSGLKMCIDAIKAILNKEDMDPKEKKSSLSEFLEKGHDTTEKALLFITMMLRKIGNIGKKVKKEDLDLCMIAEDVKDALATYSFTGIERTKVTWNKENAFVYYGNNLDTQHIVWNLVGNALKFIDQEEKGHITISFEQDTDYNKLIVCDTAKGIEPQYMSIIFEAFVTKDESGKGTGLGLSFCKSTMQNYGGDITCESKFGEYTKFICTFPKVNMDELS